MKVELQNFLKRNRLSVLSTNECVGLERTEVLLLVKGSKLIQASRIITAGDCNDAKLSAWLYNHNLFIENICGSVVVRPTNE